MIPDLINGLFEFFGAFAAYLNVLKIRKDKVVQGYSPLTTVFFSSWGLWNLFYYYHLEQYLSWFGGMAIVLVNIVWLGHVWYYKRRT